MEAAVEMALDDINADEAEVTQNALQGHTERRVYTEDYTTCPPN